MNAADLIKYGLKRVARVRLADRELIIKITDPDAVKLQKCIYAFLIGGEVVRVGSSKAPLQGRLRNYERHITNALHHKKSPTPDEEAKKWRKLLRGGTSGEIYARQGPMVKSPIGEFPAYLDEESILIGKLFAEEPRDHILNRNKHR